MFDFAFESTWDSESPAKTYQFRLRPWHKIWKKNSIHNFSSYSNWQLGDRPCHIIFAFFGKDLMNLYGERLKKRLLHMYSCACVWYGSWQHCRVTWCSMTSWSSPTVTECHRRCVENCPSCWRHLSTSTCTWNTSASCLSTGTAQT